MTYPFVSFVVPFYNAEDTLLRCVNSLLMQTEKNLEIILVDDGSNDDSAKLSDCSAATNCQVRVWHQKKQGVSVARNKGIELARGEYISFVDADDWIDLEVCKFFAEANERYDYDLFCYSSEYHEGEKHKKSYLFREDVDVLSVKQKDELFCKVMCPSAPWYECNVNTRYGGSVWGKFYRSSILKENKFRFSEETIISEDVLFNISSLEFFPKVGFTTQVFYHYQVQANSAQSRYRPDSMQYFGFVIRSIQHIITSRKKNQDVQDCANSLFVHYLFGVLKEEYFHRDNPRAKESCKELQKVLSQESNRNILERVNCKYFSCLEMFMIFLMKKRYVFLIEKLMLLKAFFCL